MPPSKSWKKNTTNFTKKKPLSSNAIYIAMGGGEGGAGTTMSRTASLQGKQAKKIF